MGQTIEQVVPVDGEDVIVIRSARRKRTVSAEMANGTLRLRAPLRLSLLEVEKHARAFRKRLTARQSSTGISDAALLERAQGLAAQYFGGAVQPTSVTWSARQLRRWGSTSSASGSIRLSARLQKMPDYVVDAVLVHELAHLIEPGHGPRFQELVARYPRATEADAFLAGVSWSDQQGSDGPGGGADL
ncbi:M48 metallopeptidase family protein [Nesterenkonia ebinurensis]|uniref:M48 metallopeptidase family protein n=1 Tax=Nesterenkonia ebinurensis TaxID=2608252 RepID=UPI001CC5E75D|nr:M48 family metallopeptidase [Nesterenkonia ebinurensis]